MPSSPSSFSYKPLDAPVDSIRLLRLNDKSKSDEFSCELIHTTFASKPGYMALSYTWGPPDPVKAITVDGHEVKIRENLYWALFNLRRGLSKLLFWVDAICINQDDLEERNRQVSLMAFIFSRAQKVLVWLGRPTFFGEIPRNSQPTEVEVANKLRKVDYWGRAWIVQEIGLARKISCFYEFSNQTVLVNWETFMETLEGIAHRENQAALLSLRLEQRGGRHRDMNELEPRAETFTFAEYQERMLPLKLKKQREGRHGDMNQLERLLETFAYTECQEPRDKIYGFLGLAHDCYNGTLKVDYSKSLFDLYKEVIAFQQAARPLDGPLPPKIDRSMRLVSFSNLVQRMLEGKVDDEIKLTFPANNILKSPTYTARGLMQGRIIHLGPFYSDTVSSFEAEKRWKASFERYYDKSEDLIRLRQQDESYTVRLIEMTDTEVAKICSFGSPRVEGFAGISANAVLYKSDWLTDKLYEELGGSVNDIPRAMANITPLKEHPNSHEPRRFLGNNCFMGLAPADAKLGDQIFHFWGCNVAAILREELVEGFRIVGRADVSTTEGEAEQQPKFMVSSSTFPSGPVAEITLDIYALQKLTR